jgi:hypothetical protein
MLKQRSELKRKTPLRPAASITKTPKPAKGPKKKTCRECKAKFEPRSPLAVACSVPCALAHSAKVTAKQKAKAQRQERAADKAKKDSMKTYPQIIAEVQKDFNAVVRLRDRLAGYPCISSGRPLDWSGNAVDAGHYRSTGSAPHLRFNFDNCHAQSKHDNQYKSGNAVDYRLGLIARIGLERVEALEADNQVRKWSREELAAMKDEFRRMARDLKKELQNV